MIASLVGNDAEFRALLPEWDALWRRAGRPPFQSPAWQLPWWDAFGRGQLRVAVVRVGGVLAGMLPLYVLGEGTERKLLPVGVGLSDYCDALLDPALPLAAIDMLLQTALPNAGAVTSCALPELPPDAALRRAACPPGWRETAMPQTPCPVLTLSDATPLPAGMLRNLRQAHHRADRRGGWRATVATAEQAPEAWRMLMQMHQRRWSMLGEPGGVLADPAVLAFHAAAIPALAASGILRLHVLHIGGRVAAVYYTMTAPDRLLFYLSGFDAADSFVSPGTLLLGHIVEQARNDGVRELHFLRGGESYKHAWGAQDRMNIGRLFLPG